MKKNDESNKPTRRLPYVPPEVVSDEVFETLALACARTQPDDFNCIGGLTS